MFRKYNITRDAKSHLSAAHPSSQMDGCAKEGFFAQRLFGYLRRHQLDFWVFQLVFGPLFFLLVLAFLMVVIGLLTEGISLLV